MIRREIADKINTLRDKFPVITVTGARQTGKTTLLKSLCSDLPYINLEEIDNRILAQTDPRGFLSNFQDGAVIDEAQQAPTLFSYIQQIVDTRNTRFILSGSYNFQLLESVTQSLAGRTAIFNLTPLSYDELISGGYTFNSYEEIVFKGGYPRLYDKSIDPEDFYPNYISSYIERDVRQIKNIENLAAFTMFIQLCAARIGQPVNLQSLATDAGISPNTAKAWLSVLEAGFVIYLLKPHHKNFNKRLIKTPKLYFYDTGLACSLLHIHSPKELSLHYLKGGLFENFIINEMSKKFLNKGIKPPLYFWQSSDGKEIDVIVDKGNMLYPFEVKTSKTRTPHLLHNLRFWKKMNDTAPQHLNVIYGGDEDFITSEGNYISWRRTGKKAEELM